MHFILIAPCVQALFHTFQVYHSSHAQVFFLLKESELTPTGSNLLDGRFSVFGYITQGQDALADFKVASCHLKHERLDQHIVWGARPEAVKLGVARHERRARPMRRCCWFGYQELMLLLAFADSLQVGDKIVYIKCISGKENLKNGPSA